MKSVLLLAGTLLLSSLAQAQPQYRSRGTAPDSQTQGASVAPGQASGGVMGNVWTPGNEAPTPWIRPTSSSGAASPPSPEASFVSVTTLAAPAAARKAYERASREMGKKNPNLAKAAAELEKAVTLYPSYAAAWYFLGGVRLVLNDVDRARGAFDSALEADPKFPYPYLPLAEIELSARRYDDAARLADSVLKLNPELFQAHYYRALANGNLGHHDKARQSIQAIVDSGNDGRYPGVHALLAVILTREGDLPSAATEYRRFLDLDPGSPVAADAREHLAQWRADALIP